MQSLYFLIPTVLILLLLFPVHFQVKVSFNALENSGIICIHVFKFKLIYFFFELDGNNIKLKNEDESNEKSFDLDSPEVALYEEFAAQLKDKTRVKFFDIFYNIGLNDAFLTSMLCGCVNLAAIIFFTSLKNKKPTASFGIYDTASFNKKVLEVAAVLSMSISLFDVVYSFLISVILSKKKASKTAI